MTIFFRCFLVSLVFSTSSETSANEETISPKLDDDIETIEVVGQRPYRFFKSEFKLKKELLFSTFNDLVEDKDMHFVCKKERVAGSHLKQEECLNAFEFRIRQEIYDDAIRRGESSSAAAVWSKQGNKELIERRDEKIRLIRELLTTQETFASVAKELKKSEDLYKQAHIAKFGSFSRYNTTNEENVSNPPENN